MQQQRDEEIRAKLLAEDRVVRLVAEKEAELEDLRHRHSAALRQLQVSHLLYPIARTRP